MSSRVIALFEGRNYKLKIELTEEQKCVVIGSDYSCRKGYIRQDETIIAPFHCRVYLRRDESRKCWNTHIQEKAMNSQKYSTYVNSHRLEMRESQWLYDNDEITIGAGEQLISFAFRDIYTRNEEAKFIEVPEVFRNRFKIMDDEIGYGAHSSIYRAKDIKDPKNPIDCVCKIVRTSKKVSKNIFDKVCQEPIILKSLNHRNIIKVLEYHQESDPDRLLMWQELLSEDLETYINKEKIVDRNTWVMMSMQIIDALGYLHERNIVHRDLKPLNIMWADTEHKTLKLIDFGLAKNCSVECSDRDTKICGTPLYTPPEIYKAPPNELHNLYKPSVDIWAFGVLTFIFLSGYTPFFNEDEVYEGDKLQNHIITRVIPKGPLQKKKIEEPIVQLITDKILNHDHEKRITASMISEFFISCITN